MSSSLPTTPTLPAGVQATLHDTLGAAFLGHFVTTLLYGITTVQAFTYYRDHRRDSYLTQFTVLVLWILDSVHAGLITAAIYWYCITNFTNLPAVQKPIWPIAAMIFVSNISNSIVRAVFGYRLYRLNNHRWELPGIIFVLSIFIIVDAFYFAAKLVNLGSYARISTISWGLYAGLSVEVAVDVIIAGAQCYLLRGFETGIRSTDMAIRILMTYSINTGLLTSLCAVGALVSYAVAPRKFVYFAFYFVLSKLYVNSLLATLNAHGSLLGRSARRRRQDKIAFRAPSHAHSRTVDGERTGGGETEYGERSQGAGIEFTTVISADAVSTDSIVETTKTKIDEEAFSGAYGA